MRWHGTELLNLGSEGVDLIQALPLPSGGSQEKPLTSLCLQALTCLMGINGCYGEHLPHGKKYSINVSHCSYETVSTFVRRN